MTAVTTTLPTEEERQQAREGLARILARRLFEEYLQEQQLLQALAANNDQPANDRTAA